MANGIFAHSSSSFVNLQSLFQFVPKAFDGVEVRDTFGLVKTHPTISLWTLLSCWNRKGPSPNCSLKFESISLSRIYLYAEALRFLFTGSKGQNP